MSSIPLSCSTTIAAVSQFSSRPNNHHKTRTHKFEVRCNSKNDETTPQNKIDRRNLLLSIGGLYGAANLVSAYHSPSLASPISAPDISKCTRGTNLNTQQPLDVNCCPPVSEKIINYKLPPVKTMRFRPAAHLACKEYITKYEKAVELMKALPDDDPRSFKQQANVHCAYCNLTYEQTGDSDTKLQVHNSWLFYPWHRWYLYFYERILGKLINDPTFGLPFWNWDNPEGMFMPDMFARKGSPLYNPLRNPNHLPPAITDLRYFGQEAADQSKVIQNNLVEMYGSMVRNVSKLEDFYGARYVTGTKPDPGAGSVERGPHTAMHVWTGQATPTGEDMGNFYSAARDSIFFSHHANVDRLWSLFSGLRSGSKPKDFPDSDWLDSNFLFYDENAQLVRVRVADTLENEKMGYTFQKVDLPWLKSRPTARVPHKNSTKVKSKIRLGLTELLEDLDVEDDDQILVSLVPKAGGEDITIGGIKIIYAA
ncbi:hypothetical protein DH2020_011693 [Rehmannia glutinosa]|uniref:Polyphenol oxidase n=1 Tax=Rehmannia glutinosa TaxID=99300 RepID=A0ABR0XED2_REHGL